MVPPWASVTAPADHRKDAVRRWAPVAFGDPYPGPPPQSLGRAGRSGHPVIAGADACSISASVVTNRSTTMKPQQQYVGLDVSLEQTSVCVVDDAGTTIWRGKCSSTPEGIHAVVAKHAREAARIGLETGQLSTWLFHELRARQLPVICIDARHAKAALSLQNNKTDATTPTASRRSSASAGIGRLASRASTPMPSSHARRPRAARDAEGQAHELHPRVAQDFGIAPGAGKGRRFEATVREQIAENP